MTWRTATLAFAALAVGAASAHGATWEARGSRLAYPLMGGGDTPELVLAQRTIEREWGLEEGQVNEPIPGWKSEPGAMALSAIVPGTGQAYVGNGGGWWFAVVEAVGWAVNLFYQREARSLRTEAKRLAGPPDDPMSPWSFERYEGATGASSSELQALYLLDPEVFMDRIGNDPALAPGWAPEAEAARVAYVETRQRSEDRYRVSGTAAAVIGLNHVVAAVDALRRARANNEPLKQQVRLRLRNRWDEDGLGLTAALERSF